MVQTTFKDVVMANAKKICGCLIEKGMNLEQAFEVVCKLIKGLQGSLDLSNVNTKNLNLKNCEDLTLAAILNALLANDASFLMTVDGLSKTINNINQNISNVKDEYVKVKGTGKAGYLGDLITTNQPGSITVNDDNIILTGFVPIGAQMMISKSRLPDFDGTGKGKTSTDLWGYAISNGKNGTTNRLGKYARYVDATLNAAGNTGGSNSLKLTDLNIPSLEIPVTGSISDGLVDPVKPRMNVNTNKLTDGSGGNTILVRYTLNSDGANAMFGDPLSIKHSHDFSLKAKRTNATVAPLDILPEYILEIPIERITV